MKITSSQRESQTPTPVSKQLHPEKQFIEEKAESLALSQSNGTNRILTPRASNPSIGIDKDKLYETFILFHSFMNMTQGGTLNAWSDSTNKQQANLQLQIDQISINKSQEVSHPYEDKQRSPQASTWANKELNYDDIPIKSTTGNFIDLVEKNLLIDKPEENSDGKNKVVKKAKSKERIPPTLHRTYQKPFLSSTLNEDRPLNRKFKQSSTHQRLALYKNKDKKADDGTPRK